MPGCFPASFAISGQEGGDFTLRHTLERKGKDVVEVCGHRCQGWHGGLGTGASRVSWGTGDTRVDLRAPSLLPQLRQRFELEIERMKQMHQKDREDQEEELEDVRQSCQKRVRELWAQCVPRSHQGGFWVLRSVGMIIL